MILALFRQAKSIAFFDYFNYKSGHLFFVKLTAPITVDLTEESLKRLISVLKARLEIRHVSLHKVTCLTFVDDSILVDIVRAPDLIDYNLDTSVLII